MSPEYFQAVCQGVFFSNLPSCVSTGLFLLGLTAGVTTLVTVSAAVTGILRKVFISSKFQAESTLQIVMKL